LTTHHFKTLRLIIAADQASMSQISDRLGAKCCHNDFYFFIFKNALKYLTIL